MKLVAIYEYQTNKLTHQQIGTEEEIAQIFEILVSFQTTWHHESVQTMSTSYEYVLASLLPSWTRWLIEEFPSQ